MDALLELKTKEQSIKELRISTAQYYQANKSFEYPEVSLMEISYLCHSALNNANDDNLCATHNKLIQILFKNGFSSVKSDINHPPYFKTTRMEYWVNNKIAHKLINKLFRMYKIRVNCALNSSSNSKSDGRKKITYRSDAIAIAIMAHILPVIFPDKKNIMIGKNTAWNCFSKLKDALLNDGSVNVELYREKNKDSSVIVGTDKDGASIDCTYKAFRGRFPNLIAAYRQLT